MYRLLLRRIPRELKANIVKYLTLFLVIVLGMYMIASFTETYDFVRYETKNNADTQNVEDGQFTVFIPLDDGQLQEVRNLGADIEEAFYYDYDAITGETFRIFKVRNNIDTIELIDGQMPSGNNQVVVDMLSARNRGHNIGDTILIGNTEMTICGIGIVPDYNIPYKNLTDSLSAASTFGLCFVNDESYNNLKKDSDSTEVNNYSFKLNGVVTYEELKECLSGMEFDYSKVDDEFYQQSVANATKTQQELKDAIDVLYEKSGELSDGIGELYEGSSTLNAGFNTLIEQADKLVSVAGQLEDGIDRYNDGLDELVTVTGQLQDGMNQADSAIEYMRDSINSDVLTESLTELDRVNGQVRERLDKYYEMMYVYINGLLKIISADDIEINSDNYYEVFESYRNELNSSVIDWLENTIVSIDSLYEMANKYIDNIEKLESAIRQLNNGINQYYDSSHQLTETFSDYYDGIIMLVDNFKTIKAAASQMVDANSMLVDGMRELNSHYTELENGLSQASEGSSELGQAIGLLDDKVTESLETGKREALNNLTMFTKSSDNTRIMGAYARATTMRTIVWSLGFLLIVMSAYILSVFVVQQLNADIKNIGALYALGVSKRQLLAHYITLPLFVAFLGGITGLGISLLPLGDGQGYYMMAGNYMIPDYRPVVQSYLIVYCIVFSMLIVMIVNVLVVNGYLSRSVLSLLNNEVKEGKLRELKFANKWSFVHLFQIRQMVRELRVCKTIIFGVFNCVTLIILGFSFHYFSDNMVNNTADDINYNYMYFLKYPTEEVPDGGETHYYKSLNYEIFGKSTSVNVIDTDSNSEYYSAAVEAGVNKIVASSAFAKKYYLSKGSRVVLRDTSSNQDYVFYISDICDYNVGLTLFMDRNSMRKLFNQPDDYYNMVLSQNNLNYEEGRLYSVIERDNVVSGAQAISKQVNAIVVIAIGVGSVIMLLVMYILMSITIDRSQYGISLVKIFGFSDKEVNRLYMRGNLFVVIFGAIIALPCGKFVSKLLITFALLNLNVGLDVTFPWYMYVVIVAWVVICYYIANALLRWKLAKVGLTEALKGRG